jgi:putative transposase
MQVNKAYKLALYPNESQEQRLWQIVGACRFIWNHYLEERKTAYLERGENMNYAACAKDLTGFKKLPKIMWLNGVPVHPLQQSLRDLDVAFNKFFRKQARFPKFKSRKNAVHAFRIPVGWRLRGNKIQTERDVHILGRGTFPPEEAVLKALTIKNENGRWFAVILVEQEIEPALKTGEPIGIDLGLTDLIITSDGKRWPNLKPRRSIQRSIKRASQDLARKQKGSNRRAKAKQRLTRLYRKAANRRMNHLHQTSHRITSENQAVIVCEDLAVKNMMCNHSLAGSIADASWAELLRQIEYKQLWRGGQFVKIDRFFPSSKTCSECQFILGYLSLNDRRWTCPGCGTEHDRDVNAAKMILKQGEERLGVEGKDGNRRKPVRVACLVKRKANTVVPLVHQG